LGADKHTTRILSWLDNPRYKDEMVSLYLQAATKNILLLRAEQRKTIEQEEQRIKDHTHLMEEIERMEPELKEKEQKL
jgi:uncharacterized protein (UPF0305 family)